MTISIEAADHVDRERNFWFAWDYGRWSKGRVKCLINHQWRARNAQQDTKNAGRLKEWRNKQATSAEIVRQAITC